MTLVRMFAVAAGFFFAVYPLFLSKSGLNGNWQAVAFTGFACFLVLPLAIHSGMGSLKGANWWFVVASGIAGASGMILLTRMLAQAPTKDYGELFAIMMTVQIIIIASAAAYARRAAGEGIPWDKAVWYVVICIGAFKLLR